MTDPRERIARIEARIERWKRANEEQYQRTRERLDSLEALLREGLDGNGPTRDPVDAPASGA